MNTAIRSDDLPRLRELFLIWAPLFSLLELMPQVRLVIDANVVIEELLFLTQARRNPAARTSLQEAVDSGTVVALAPFELKDEISEHLPRLALERGVPEEALRRAWLEYQTRIRFVDAGPVPASAAADPDDLPYVYLYRKANADAVLSRDRHIRAMGAASVELEVLLHARNYARAKALEVTLRVGGFTIAAPAVAGLLALGKLLGRGAKGLAGLPREAQLALLAGTLALVAHPRTRKAVSTLVRARSARLKEPARVLLRALGTLAEEWDTARRRVRAEQNILERDIPRATRRPLRLVAHSVCLEAGRALTAEELTRGVLRAGYESESARLKDYLLKILRRSDLFISTPDGHWIARA